MEFNSTLVCINDYSERYFVMSLFFSLFTWLMAILNAASACCLSNASACCCILSASGCCEGCGEDMSITDDLMASILLMLSIEALIAFMAFTDADKVSFVIGGVDGLDELFTWFAWNFSISRNG